VSSGLERFLEFLAAQEAAQAPRFRSVPVEKVLTFMATTGRPGSLAKVSVHALRGVAEGSTPPEVRVELGGRLPQRPAPRECLAVHLARLERYLGYQVKTRPLGAAGEGELCREDGAGLTVLGSQLFTVHLSPYTLRFFERVPYEEVRQLAGEVRHAICAVGEAANVSPRFVFHREVRGGQLALFHGDGLPLKTWLNLRRNRRETRLVLDLDTFQGWALRGTVEEIGGAAHPVGVQKVHDGFAAGGWGRPSRCFRFVAEELEELGVREGG
jgi:hypothetical protein